tara:strand:- start:539 stop:1126 length:588 start_codon:yes stop_codon:yes gene_type:complete
VLPDFVHIKSEYAKQAMRKAMAISLAKHQVISKLSGTIQHEGSEVELVDIEGNVTLDHYKRLESLQTIDHAKLPTMDLGDWVAFYTKIYDEIHSQQVKRIIEVLDESTAASGNVLHGNNQGLTEDLFLKMLDMVHLDFDNPDPLKDFVIITSPEGAKRVPKDLETNPEFERKQTEILCRKREQWRLESIDKRLAN